MDENAFYKELIKRYKENKATTEEVEVFFHLLKEGKLDAHLIHSMDAAIFGNEEIKTRVFIKNIPSWLRVAAVVFILLTGIVGYFFSMKMQPNELAHDKHVIPQITDLPPGSNRAILQLADNSFIVLDSVKNGPLTQQGSSMIEKGDGWLTYKEGKTSATVQYNSLTTPRGGQYQLILPDGSKAWLNAGSSIHYPVAFTSNNRSVEVKGEAYFEVASFSKNGRRVPFIVKVNDMEVEVLGTHFNIMAYQDEASIKTTLLEGSIKIIAAGNVKLLKPGQQAQLKKDGSINIELDSDLEEAVAWKNGFFQFNSADIKTMMRQVERWYDVEVIYENKKIAKHFTGTVSRNAHLSKLLKILESAGVPFKIQDKKIIIE